MRYLIAWLLGVPLSVIVLWWGTQPAAEKDPHTCTHAHLATSWESPLTPRSRMGARRAWTCCRWRSRESRGVSVVQVGCAAPATSDVAAIGQLTTVHLDLQTHGFLLKRRLSREACPL
jgi:hypothetical protein